MKVLHTVTPLDKAVKAALEQKDKTPDFYRLFLRTRIFAPIRDVPQVEGQRKPAVMRGTFSFRVKLLRNRRILMIFDTPMRLKRAFKTPTQFVSLAAGALLSKLPPDHYVLLNAGAPFAKMFFPKEIAWLKKVPLKPIKRKLRSQ